MAQNIEHWDSLEMGVSRRICLPSEIFHLNIATYNTAMMSPTR